MLTTFNEIDMSGYINLRNDYGELFLKKHNIKLGFMSGFVKASSLALKDQPIVNAVIDGADIVYRDFVDISVAVSTPKGLVVPVLRNTQAMEMHEVERELAHLGKKAKDGLITLEDMTGGTFTITNGGVFGSMMGTPIINPPQSAILGMHATKNRPVCVGNKIEARPIMYVALTYDHRIIDGREAVLFLKQIKEIIEDPRRILLDI
jgi:2-oxoglutarate dehydrogenase E2 component (dihydrolipoamide succinyltransferase)